jgi:glycosyltransferase involved in cell wall biosynthesis
MTQKKYSIAMVAACPFPANYGSPASIREMSETLAGFGHDVHIVTYPHGDDLPVGAAHIHRITPTGGDHKVRVGPSADKPALDWKLLKLLLRVIREHEIQVIHSHNYEAALIGLAAKAITGKPLLYNAVNTMSDELAGYGFIKPEFLAHALAKALDLFVPAFPDHITAVSELLRDGLVRQGVSPDRVTYVPAGILPELFDHADAAKMRARFPLGNATVVMYTGTSRARNRPRG